MSAILTVRTLFQYLIMHNNFLIFVSVRTNIVHHSLDLNRFMEPKTSPNVINNAGFLVQRINNTIGFVFIINFSYLFKRIGKILIS